MANNTEQILPLVISSYLEVKKLADKVIKETGKLYEDINRPSQDFFHEDPDETPKAYKVDDPKFWQDTQISLKSALAIAGESLPGVLEKVAEHVKFIELNEHPEQVVVNATYDGEGNWTGYEAVLIS